MSFRMKLFWASCFHFISLQPPCVPRNKSAECCFFQQEFSRKDAQEQSRKEESGPDFASLLLCVFARNCLQLGRAYVVGFWVSRSHHRADRRRATLRQALSHART